MCKYCDKDLYYDSNFHHSDAGYGDDDWDETEKHLVKDFLVCPVCGRIKDEAIKKYGSLDEILRIIVATNTDGFGTNVYLSTLNRLKEDSSKIKREFLEKNGITLHANQLVCRCGKVLKSVPEHYTLKDILRLLKESEITFCSKCGKKVIEVDARRFAEELVEKPLDLIVETKKK